MKLLKKEKTTHHLLRLSMSDTVEVGESLRQSHNRLLRVADELGRKIREHREQIRML